jgi:hypothetical protein
LAGATIAVELSWLAEGQTSFLVVALDYLPDADADVLVVHARVRLRRLTPTAIKQNAGGLHARGGWVFSLAHNRGEVTNTLLCICPAQ